MRITCCHFIYVVISICVWNKCSSYVEYAHKSVPYRNVLISRPIDSETYGFERWVSFLLYFSTLFSWTGTEIDTLRGEKLVFPMNLGRIIDDNQFASSWRWSMHWNDWQTVCKFTATWSFFTCLMEVHFSSKLHTYQWVYKNTYHV